MPRRLFFASLFATSLAASSLGNAHAQQPSARNTAIKTGAVIVAPKRATSHPVRAAVSVKTPASLARPASAKNAKPAPAPVAPVEAESAVASFEPEPGGYTGVIIDTRHLSEISRSPAPALYGEDAANNNGALLYPDRAHVPTPDEVQDFTVVRYYYDETEAKTRLVGANPLILRAVAVVGPARDAVTLSAADALLLAQADKSAHFTRNWRVGFLLPSGK